MAHAAQAPMMLDALREALSVLQSVAAMHPDWHAAAMARDSVSAAISAAQVESPMPAAWLPPCDDEATLAAREDAADRDAWRSQQAEG